MGNLKKAEFIETEQNSPEELSTEVLKIVQEVMTKPIPKKKKCKKCKKAKWLAKKALQIAGK